LESWAWAVEARATIAKAIVEMRSVIMAPRGSSV
jgi:hypothetical protein